MPTPNEIAKAMKDAATADDFRTVEGAIAASKTCEKHCVMCEGEDHHWMADCPEDGEPLMVCKHCPAWREMRDDDLED
jgi:predicted peroxiredoxin